MNKKRMLEIWEEVKANKKKLKECSPPHDFIHQEVVNKLAPDYVCRKCKGKISSSEHYWYDQGLEHGEIKTPLMRLRRVMAHEEDVTEPIKAEVIVRAKDFIRALDEEKLVPNCIGKCEDGLCFQFKRGSGRLYVEFYNSGEAGYLIEDLEHEAPRANKDFDTIDEAVRVVGLFMK